jgi:hypothetical protein
METTITPCSGCWDESCTDCNPEEKTEANGWHGTPSALHGRGSALVNPASDKQVNYLRTLCQRTGEPMPALPIAKAEASRMIDRLVNLPNKPGITGASDKQSDFIRTLWAQKHLPGDVEAVIAAIPDRMTASKMIDALKAVKDEIVKADAPNGDDLEDAIYKIDGQVRKVYHTQSGQQVAKVWDTDSLSFEYVGKKGLKGLTPAHKMTMAEAVEFGSIYGICCNCSRTLTDEHSIEAGIGPVCARRFA